MHHPSSLFSAILFILRTASAFAGNETHLHVNTIIGVNGASAFQCWAVDPPFVISTQPGSIGARVQSMGDMSGGNMVFYDENEPTIAGLHNSPAPQWVIILKGTSQVTLPTTNEQLTFPAGTVIIVNDTAAVSKLGHNSKYPAGTVTMQLPFQGGVIPSHTVVNDGPCAGNGPY